MTLHPECRSVRTPFTELRTGWTGAYGYYGSVSTDGFDGATVTLPLDRDELVFQGHYRGFPIFAGVFLVETAHRAALVHTPADVPRLRLARLESARFLHPSYPGDTLHFTLRWKRDTQGWVCRVTAATDDHQVARIRLRYESADAPVAPLPAVGGPAAGEPASGSRAGLGPLSLPEVMARIPHRDQLLLIDRVDTFHPGDRVTAVKAVTFGEPWYRWLADEAADPGAYSYPIGLLMESFNQAAAVLATAERANTDVLADEVLMLGGYTDLAFGTPVLPGDLLEHSVRLARTVDGVQIFEGTTRVRGEVVLTVGAAVLARRPAGALVG
ncbi:3-hydroxyacyl-ACP dehydratase FabZ family protein [Streptomyces sp. CG1]|uniref:3-hydroxyacyl-ACP dehydratase FabZ family protein n=1 Tax=Streptomyces sp. CG1 TaxID=1287523 RepID=UPI0034E2BC5D